MTTEPVQVPVAAPAAAPGPTPSPTDAQGDGYDPKWLSGLDERRQADVQAWADQFHASKVKPMESELHGLQTKVGRLEKATRPEIVALLEDHDTFLGELRQAATILYGVSEEDVKEATTVRELRLLLRGRMATRSAPKGDPAAGQDDETKKSWQEFVASRGGAPQPGDPRKPNGAVDEPRTRAGGGAGQQDYKERLRNGPMPSAAEIDRMTTARYLR